jgi:hypothetical protein
MSRSPNARDAATSRSSAAEQGPPVGQAREVVRERQPPRGGQGAQLVHGEDRAPQGQHDGERGEVDGDRRDVVRSGAGVVDEDAERAQRAGERHARDRQPAQGDVARGPRRPGGQADERGAQGPAQVDEGARAVRHVRVLVEVGHVGDDEDDQPGPDEHPRPAQLEARHGQDREHQDDEHHVAGGVGHADDERDRVLVAPQAGQDEGAADRGRGHGGRDPVEPHAAGRLQQPAAGEQGEPQVGQGVQGEPADVGGRRGEEVLLAQQGRLEDVAARPDQEPGGQERPGEPVGRAQPGAGRARAARREQHAVHQQLLGDRAQRLAGGRQAQGEQHERRGLHGPQERQPPRCPALAACRHRT